MQNTSPPPESLSTSSSTRQPSFDAPALISSDNNAGKVDVENNSTARNFSRRNTNMESPTKQFYQYGSAGFDLYGMRDDETELDADDDEEEEEEIVSNDSSVSEMTNPTFFSQQESMLFSRSANLASMGLNSQKIERGPTPSESESSIDQSESATPLIGGGTLSASQSSQEKGGERAVGEREQSDDDSERSDDILTFSAGDWKRIPFNDFMEYSDQSSMKEIDCDESVENESFADPPLDCVEDDSDSEPSPEAVSMNKATLPLKEEKILDDMDENLLHLTVAAIRSARRQTKIEYDVKLKAINLESDMTPRGSSLVDSNIYNNNSLDEKSVDYSTTRNRRTLEKNIDRMNIAEVCSSGNIRHASNVQVPYSSHRKREVYINTTASKPRRLYAAENSIFDDSITVKDKRKALLNFTDASDAVSTAIVKPFDEGDFDDELCEIHRKQTADPISYAGRPPEQDLMKTEKLVSDRSITPIMSSRLYATTASTSSSLNATNHSRSSYVLKSQDEFAQSPNLVSRFILHPVNSIF